MKAFLCRCLPLLLLFALIFTALAACATEPGGASGASEAGGVSSGAESAAEGFPLEEKNFGGKEITVLCVDRHTYGVMQFVPGQRAEGQRRQRRGGPSATISLRKSTG